MAQRTDPLGAEVEIARYGLRVVGLFSGNQLVWQEQDGEHRVLVTDTHGRMLDRVYAGADENTAAMQFTARVLLNTLGQ